MDQEGGVVKQRNKKIAITVVGILALAWIIVGAGFFGSWLSSNVATNSSSLNPEVDGNMTMTDEEADLAELVKSVSPSVVSIVTTQTAGRGYFQQEYEGAGTGIVISSDGYILTNKHVVEGASGLEIVATDGTRYEDVQVVGSDPLNDIAFLKIRNVSDLPVATLGDSGTVRVGQRVFAIGNSLGQYQNTVTSGIISGLGRPVVASADELGTRVESLTDLLQTDAAINPGNSGGPLINMAGQVVGINTAIVSDAQSIGFAIPINASKGLIRGVLADGTIQKAYIGVQYTAITPDVRAEFDLPVPRGAYVQPGGRTPAVVQGSPADRAGVRVGDIITKVNDKEVGVHGGLGSLISEFLPGEKATLTVVRDGRTEELSLTLGSYSS